METEMKRPAGFLTPICLLLVVLALGACTAHVSSAAVEAVPTSQQSPQIHLRARLAAPATLPDGHLVELEFTLANHSETALYVLKWYTALEGLGGDIFRVERDGDPLPYEGPLAMRGDPTPDAYVFLEPGETATAAVDLAAAYDFSEPGRYTISFNSPWISHVAMTRGRMASSVDDLGPVRIPSNEVSVEIQRAAAR
jgi:hypothetical protein